LDVELINKAVAGNGDASGDGIGEALITSAAE
jgi:hypothetical protein